MKKYIFFLISLFFLFSLTSNKVYAGVVTYPEESNIFLSTQNITLAVEANSSADLVVVSENNITVTVSAPDSFIIRSDEKYNLENNGGVTQSCAVNLSRLTIQPSSGTITVIITPTKTVCVPGSSLSSSSNNSKSTECNDQPPGAKAPWLYGAIPQDGNSILLYFTDADSPVDKYVLQFGLKSGDYPWGSPNIGGKGMRTYQVNFLAPNTTYVFRVRAGNGCAAGSWSNEISAKTKGLISYNQLDIKTLKPPPATQAELAKALRAGENPKTLETKAQKNYTVKIKVRDTNNNSVIGAKVAIHSKEQKAITDKNGIVKFKKIEKGNHKILISYNNFKGEQTINLSGDVKEFNLNITIKEEKTIISPMIYVGSGVLIFVIIVLLILLIKAKRK